MKIYAASIKKEHKLTSLSSPSRYRRSRCTDASPSLNRAGAAFATRTSTSFFGSDLQSPVQRNQQRMDLPSPISQRAKRITSPEQVGPVAREGETGEECVLCSTRKVMARVVCELVGRAWRAGGVTSGCEAVDEEGPLGERSSRRRRGGGAGAVRKGGGRGGQGA
jgi:hypothetical protein